MRNKERIINITIDSREQKPLIFSHPYINKVETKKLDVGDYSATFNDGYIPPFTFDRKSIPDLFGTMGRGYKRFKKCMALSQERNIRLFIIIEGSLSKVYKGYDRSQLKGESVVKKLFTLWHKHEIQPIFCANRQDMAEYITYFYLSCGWEYLRRKGK